MHTVRGLRSGTKHRVSNASGEPIQRNVTKKLLSTNLHNTDNRNRVGELAIGAMSDSGTVAIVNVTFLRLNPYPPLM